MPASDSTRIELDCPQCGYSLKGQEPAGSVLRCPECGRLTSLRFILEDQRRRNRGRRDLFLALGLGAAACALAMIFGFRARLQETSIRSLDHAGLIAAITFAIALVMSLRWISAPWKHRVFFALGLSGLVVLFVAIRGPLSYVTFAAAVAWFVGYHVHALRRGYY